MSVPFGSRTCISNSRPRSVLHEMCMMQLSEQKIQQMGKENYDQMRRDEERERRLRQKTQKAAAAAAEAQEENEGGETAPADEQR